MPVELTDQDWDFKALWQPHRAAELIVAGFYEHSREWRTVTAAVKEWLRFEKPRAKMFQRAKDQNIKLNDLHRACLFLVQAGKWNLTHEPEYEPDWPQFIRHSVERDNPAAVKLLSRLSNKYREVVRSEYIMQFVEDFGRKGEPRIRFLARYLTQDTPWLRIPAEDRSNAIKHAFKSNSEGPQDADGLTFFRPLAPVERMDELQDLVRSRKALPISYSGDVDVKLEMR